MKIDTQADHDERNWSWERWTRADETRLSKFDLPILTIPPPPLFPSHPLFVLSHTHGDWSDYWTASSVFSWPNCNAAKVNKAHKGHLAPISFAHSFLVFDLVRCSSVHARLSTSSPVSRFLSHQSPSNVYIFLRTVFLPCLF